MRTLSLLTLILCISPQSKAEYPGVVGLGDYLTTSSATATYLQSSSATATYLQQSSATITYIQRTTVALTDLLAATSGYLTDWDNMADVAIVTGQVTNGTLLVEDLAASASGYLTDWDNMADVAIVTGQITDGTIGTSDLSAACSGYLTDWDNIADMPSGFADGTDDTGGGGASYLAIAIDGINVTTPTVGVDLRGAFWTGLAVSNTAQIYISTGMPVNGGVTTFCLADQIYDWGAATYEPLVTEGSLDTGVVVSDDIKDGTVALADLTAACSGYGCDWDNATDVSILTAQLAAATSGYLTDWDSLADVPAGFADGTDDTGAGTTAGAKIAVAVDEVNVTTPTVGINFKNVFNGYTQGTTAYIFVSTAAPSNGDTTHLCNADQIRDYTVGAAWIHGMTGVTLAAADEFVVYDDTAGTGDKITYANLITQMSDNIAADIAEGELANSIVVSDDIKDGEIALADLAAATSGYLTDWDNMADVEIVTAQISDGTIGTGDLSAACSGYLTDYDNMADVDFDAIAGAISEGALANNSVVSADIKDGEIVAADMTAATTGWFVDWDNFADVEVLSANIKDGEIVAGDMTAATTGWFVDWDNMADVEVVSAQISDATIVAGDMTAATTGWFVDADNLADKAGLIDTVFEAIYGDFDVCISTPNILTAGKGYQISKSFSFAVTYTTITAQCNDAGTFTFMIEERLMTAIGSAGTDVWSGDVTADTTWRGGTFSNAGIAANAALFLVPTSGTGNIPSLSIQGARTKD